MADVESGSHTDEAQNRTEEKRHAGTIDEQAESDSEQNEEQGGCAGAGVGYESSKNDVGEGGNHNQQGNQAKMAKRILAFSPMLASIIWPILLPLWRKEATKEP